MMKLNEPIDAQSETIEFCDDCKVRPGDIIALDNERVWVKNVTGNTAIAARGYGSDACEHGCDCEVNIVARAMGK